jgi:hypothetical protein
MKNKANFSAPALIGFLLIGLFSTWFAPTASADCLVVSTNGYSVSISVTPTAIVPTSSSCVNGYNFNYALKYDIKFTGTNIPSNLYTLQGNVLSSGYSSNFFSLPKNGGTGTIISTGNNYTSRKDCNSATVNSFNPSVQIIIQGPGLPSQTINCPIIALPIELVSFTGTKTKEGIALEWATANEKDNKYFTLEKSKDAVQWEAQSIINGAGTSNQKQEYAYIDAQPLSGINYYRVKQTDLNGIFTYSSIIQVDYTVQTIETSIYPNPAIGFNTNIRIATSSSEPIEIQIFDSFGQNLKDYFIETKNIGLSTHTLELPQNITMCFVNIIQNGAVIGRHQLQVIQ